MVPQPRRGALITDSFFGGVGEGTSLCSLLPAAHDSLGAGRSCHVGRCQVVTTVGGGAGAALQVGGGHFRFEGHPAGLGHSVHLSDIQQAWGHLLVLGSALKPSIKPCFPVAESLQSRRSAQSSGSEADTCPQRRRSATAFPLSTAVPSWLPWSPCTPALLTTSFLQSRGLGGPSTRSPLSASSCNSTSVVSGSGGQGVTVTLGGGHWVVCHHHLLPLQASHPNRGCKQHGKGEPLILVFCHPLAPFYFLVFFHPFFLPPSAENLGTEPSATLSEIDARLQALQAYISTLGTHM